MKDMTRNTHNPLAIMVLALLVIFSSCPLFGNDTAAKNAVASAPGPRTTQRGWLAAPTYTQEWSLQGTQGDRLVITTSPLSDTIVPEIYLMSAGDNTPVASATGIEGDHLVLDHELEATGTYIVAIRDQGLDNEGTYEISLEKTAAQASARQASEAGTAVDAVDEDGAGLSGWEIGTMVGVGTVLTVLTGPFAPLAMMVAARIAVLFPG